MDLDKQEICIRSDIIKRFINRSVEKKDIYFWQCARTRTQIEYSANLKWKQRILKD